MSEPIPFPSPEPLAQIRVGLRQKAIKAFHDHVAGASEREQKELEARVQRIIAAGRELLFNRFLIDVKPEAFEPDGSIVIDDLRFVAHIVPGDIRGPQLVLVGTCDRCDRTLGVGIESLEQLGEIVTRQDDGEEILCVDCQAEDLIANHEGVAPPEGDLATAEAPPLSIEERLGNILMELFLNRIRPGAVDPREFVSALPGQGQTN